MKTKRTCQTVRAFDFFEFRSDQIDDLQEK